MPKYKTGIVLAYFEEMKLPQPAPEWRFHPVREWRFDFAWPEHRVALEVEGAVWVGGRHNRGAGMIADMEKYNEAAALGWRVLRCTPQQLCMADMADLIHRTLCRTTT